MKTEITIHTNTQKTNSEVNVLKCTDISPQNTAFYLLGYPCGNIVSYPLCGQSHRKTYPIFRELYPYANVDNRRTFLPVGASLLFHQILFHRQLKRSHRLYRAFLYHAAFYAHLGNKIRHHYHNPTRQYNRT